MSKASAGGLRRRRRGGKRPVEDDFLPPCCDPEAKEVRRLTPEQCETVQVATRAEQNEVLKCFLAKDEFNSREERLWIRRRVTSGKKYGCVSFLLFSEEKGNSSSSSSSAPVKRTPQGAVTVRINTCQGYQGDDRGDTRWCQVMNTAVWVPQKGLGTRIWQDVEERLRNDHEINIAVLYPVAGAQKFWRSRGFKKVDLLPGHASESLLPEVDFDGNELPLWQKDLKAAAPESRLCRCIGRPGSECEVDDKSPLQPNEHEEQSAESNSMFMNLFEELKKTFGRRELKQLGDDSSRACGTPSTTVSSSSKNAEGSQDADAIPLGRHASTLALDAEESRSQPLALQDVHELNLRDSTAKNKQPPRQTPRRVSAALEHKRDPERDPVPLLSIHTHQDLKRGPERNPVPALIIKTNANGVSKARKGKATITPCIGSSDLGQKMTNGVKRRYNGQVVQELQRTRQASESMTNESVKRPRAADQDAKLTASDWEAMQDTVFQGYPQLPDGWIYCKSSKTGDIYCFDMAEKKSTRPEALGVKLAPDQKKV